MLYLDYNRKDGEWVANMYGGRENLAAVDFLKKLNNTVHSVCPEAMMIAEESTAWPSVTGSTNDDWLALGFDYKWNMGWMNDMLSYIHEDPLWRNYHHGTLTFSLVYAFSEHFILPISHDEVVYGKGSLINKMPGDDFWKMAGVRNFVSYMIAHPGKKLMFMGSEIGQWNEWNANTGLEWSLLDYEPHRRINLFFREINHFYLDNPALYENDDDWHGFNWINFQDSNNSVIDFMRIGLNGDYIICICNFQPVTREHYRIGVPEKGVYTEVFNSESYEFGGTGIGNPEGIHSEPIEKDGRENSMELTLPPLGVVFFKLTEKEEEPVEEEPATEETDVPAETESAETAPETAETAGTAE
jgi:1,4-alpha-glucan branching enzyme